MPPHTERSPLLGLQFVRSPFQSPLPRTIPQRTATKQEEMRQHERKQFLYTFFISSVLLAALCLLKESSERSSSRAASGKNNISLDNETDSIISDVMMAKNASPLRQSTSSSILSALEEEFSSNSHKSTITSSSSANSRQNNNISPYTKVQTLSFQIYTGGAPALIPDETTDTSSLSSSKKLRRNHECKGLHSYGKSEDSDLDGSSSLQCYLGLEDTAADVEKRMGIMVDAVNKAYDASDKDESTLKIFLAPEFFWRGKNGSFEFKSDEEKEANGECGDVCHILKGLENITADKRFENWLFLFGTVIGSEVLPKEDEYDYQFYNFAPMYKGYDPATSKGIGKNFLVPKRYVSNIDFLTPLRHLTNKANAMELLDDFDASLDRTLANPHLSGHKRYDNEIWLRYKEELTSLGYNMIEYGWFYMDGIAFSVEICLDHLVHRSLMTYMADVVTGSNTRIPSSSNDHVEWVGLPRNQAQISLVASAGMDITVASLALANGGHIFLQDGVHGNQTPHSTYGTDECSPNEYEFFGGSQSITRTAVISPTDVTFEYAMNLNFSEFDLYPDDGERYWKDVLKGVFSSTTYQPKLTVYDPVDIVKPTFV